MTFLDFSGFGTQIEGGQNMVLTVISHSDQGREALLSSQFKIKIEKPLNCPRLKIEKSPSYLSF